MATVALFSSTSFAAADPMRAAFAPKIQSLAEVLKNRQKNAKVVEVAPAQVLQRANRPPGGEAEIRRIVLKLFEENGVTVTPSATWGLRIECKFGNVVDPADAKGEVVGQIFTLQLASPTGDDPAALRVAVPGVDSLVRVTAVCVDASGEPSTAAIDKKVLAVLGEKPTVFAKDSAVRSSETSAYQVELLIDDKPVMIENQDGLAVAKLPVEKAFTVRLKNHSKLDAAADLRLDGVSAFEFTTIRKENRPAFTHYVIPPGETVDVKGWHKDHKTAFDFRVKTFAESAAGELKLDQEVTRRTIAVYFSLAWLKGQPQPKEEPAHPRGDPSYGIGRGTEFNDPTKEVEKTIGSLQASVVIRYDVPK